MVAVYILKMHTLMEFIFLYLKERAEQGTENYSEFELFHRLTYETFGLLEIAVPRGTHPACKKDISSTTILYSRLFRRHCMSP